MAKMSDSEFGRVMQVLAQSVIALAAVGLVSWLLKTYTPLGWVPASIISTFIVSGIIVILLFRYADHEYQGLD